MARKGDCILCMKSDGTLALYPLMRPTDTEADALAYLKWQIEQGRAAPGEWRVATDDELAKAEKSWDAGKPTPFTAEDFKKSV